MGGGEGAVGGRGRAIKQLMIAPFHVPRNRLISLPPIRRFTPMAKRENCFSEWRALCEGEFALGQGPGKCREMGN